MNTLEELSKTHQSQLEEMGKFGSGNTNPLPVALPAECRKATSLVYSNTSTLLY